MHAAKKFHKQIAALIQMHIQKLHSFTVNHYYHDLSLQHDEFSRWWWQFFSTSYNTRVYKMQPTMVMTTKNTAKSKQRKIRIKYTFSSSPFVYSYFCVFFSRIKWVKMEKLRRHLLYCTHTHIYITWVQSSCKFMKCGFFLVVEILYVI